MYTPSEHALTTPDKPAIVMTGSGERVSYRQLEERANQASWLFRACGLGLRDSIAIFLENNRQFLEICCGADRSGIYYSPISSRLTAPEVDYIVGDCAAQLFITSKELAPVAEALALLMPNVKRRFVVGGTLPGYESWEAALASMPTTPIPDQAQGRDMLYSSGTTGRPKGVRRELNGDPYGTPSPLLGLIEKLYGFGPDIRYLSPAPLYHAAPLRYNMSVLAFGGTTFVMDKFDPEQALALIEQHRITHSQWVPTMFVRMLKLPAEIRRRYDVSSLKVAIHAAAPCPVAVKEQMIDWWGPVLYEYYAGTEGNGLCAIDSNDWLAHKGSVGRALLGEVHIMDELGNERAAGEEGVIYFANGPAFEYHNDPAKTAESRNEKGWTTLGDIGRLDAEGYLYLTDRKAYMIISGGVNIYPQEAENILINHPKVADVAVIGVPNEEMGEEVKAVVQPVDMRDAGPDLAEELIAYCRRNLASIKCPRSVDFDEQLPRHPTGKLYKRLIRDRYWGQRLSRIV
ncbi:MAG: AMP-binding protein [Alphaproteobacteria bacterium]|nr:AMP-binding protein [Alphaproteobacteria bacterium]